MAIGLVNMGVDCMVTGWDLTFVRSCVVQNLWSMAATYD